MSRNWLEKIEKGKWPSQGVVSEGTMFSWWPGGVGVSFVVFGPDQHLFDYTFLQVPSVPNDKLQGVCQEAAMLLKCNAQSGR